MYVYKIEILFTITFQARKKARKNARLFRGRKNVVREKERRREGNEGGIRIRARRRRKGEFDRVSVAGARIALNNPAS